MLNNKAHKKLSTSNPGTIALASMTIRAFITKVNKPSVKILSGKVSAKTIGRIKALIRPKISAVTRAAKNPLTITPESKYAVIIMASPETSQ